MNLLTGPGGRDREPGTDFRFIRESVSGTSPKFEVEDENGVTWKAKLGEEVHGETAAARLLWAAGYVVDEDYYRPQIRVRGMQTLNRGQQFVSADGLVTGVRLERDVPNADTSAWSWYDNPLLGTREFNGLRVMMALINNWDLKAINNGDAATAERPRLQHHRPRLVVRPHRPRAAPQQGCRDGVRGEPLHRQGHADPRRLRPAQPSVLPHRRPHHELPFPHADGEHRQGHSAGGCALDRRPSSASCPTAQIGDCFRAGGFTPADVAIYTQVVMRRIAALRDLPAPSIVGARFSRLLDLRRTSPGPA